MFRKREKKILITFDYELFLGEKSGKVYDCLIAPTEKILRIFEKYNSIKCIFFIDTVYIQRMEGMAIENVDCRNDLNLIYLQLANMVNKGHYIFSAHPSTLARCRISRIAARMEDDKL